MTTFKDAVSYLISRIRLTSPTLDTSPASPVRTVLDAVAELHAQASLAEDKAYDWDISTKTGRDLDDFVSMFGFGRLPSTFATGFVTVTFAANTTRDYIVDQGTRVSAFRPGQVQIDYITTTNVAIPRYSAFATLPVIAAEPGAASNARPYELNYLDMEMDGFVMVKNENAISGGSPPESDTQLRDRFRANLFRNVLGTEEYYRSVGLRHPRVSSIQVIRPFMETEEYLKVVNGKVQCQEDSVLYTYPANVAVLDVENNKWLTEGRDFVVSINNDDPVPPEITFRGNSVSEGANVTVRYGYSSVKGRNNPLTNVYHYLDIFILGRQPMPITDYASFPNINTFGLGTITKDTHPDGIDGLPYYIFTRQPVVKLHPEFEVSGRRYYEGRDYMLVRDRTPNQGSTRARDLLVWLTSLPPTGTTPDAFFIPYFSEGVIEEVQDVLDDPDVVVATDDILAHIADEIILDIDLNIEWERGVQAREDVGNAIRDYFAIVEMGTKVRVGRMMRAVNQLPRVSSVELNAITSATTIRGKNSWRHDVPLIDGTVPILGNLTINTIASNTFED